MKSKALPARAMFTTRRRAGAALLALLGLVLGFFGPVSARASASGFTISGTRIVGPDGHTFLPIGANFQGPQSFWPNATKGRSDAAIKWGWNTVRLNACMVGGCEATGGYAWPTNDDLDGIVNEYTSKGVVVMIDLHQIAPGSWPTTAELPQIVSWWRDIATRFKSNPYVWFDVLNEPGYGSTGTAEWLAMHATLVDVIRAAGASNVVVVEGTQWGQDAGAWDNSPVQPANSALLSYGQQLLAGRSNILFSIHAYDQWGQDGTDAQRDSRLADYIDRVHAAGLALVIGELGGPWDNPASWLSRGAASAYRVAPAHGVGVLAWHAQPGDGFALTNLGDFDRLDSWTNPTNLTWSGRFLWDLGAANRAAHAGSTTTTTAPATTTTVAPTTTTTTPTGTGAAVRYVASTSSNTVSAAPWSTVITTVPAAARAGDTLVAFVSHAGDNPVTAPAGWSKLGSSTTANATDVRIDAFWTRSPGGKTASWAFAKAGDMTVGVLDFRGATSATAAFASSNGQPASTVSVPRLASVPAGSMLAFAVASGGNANSANPPAGATERIDKAWNLSLVAAATAANPTTAPSPSGAFTLATRWTSGSVTVALSP